jgi:hypothetical protein
MSVSSAEQMTALGLRRQSTNEEAQ